MTMRKGGTQQVLSALYIQYRGLFIPLQPCVLEYMLQLVVAVPPAAYASLSTFIHDSASLL